MSRAVRVLDPGTATTVQDSGRPGHAHLGVPRSGWLDPPSARLANRLVGNPDDAAVLECVLGGLVLETRTALTVAVTGATCPVRVDGRPVAFGEPVTVPAGGRVGLGVAATGLRAYVALAGGVLVEPVLGSRSTDTLSGLGPPPLAAGDLLPVGPVRGLPRPVDVAVHGPAPAAVTVLRCRPGPRADWLSEAAHRTLARATYAVSPASDRVGLRLEGPALERDRGGELPSEGLVLGAVQVPADGRPLVFLADHPTTGGYPVVAVVEPMDLARCAQLRPGDRVRLAPAGPAGPAGAGGAH